MADDLFLETLDKVISLEGGYRLHKNEGEDDVTYAGIYRKAWPSWIGWNHLPNIPRHMVNEFYFTNFWRPLNGIQPSIKPVIFDSAVNIGFRETIKLLQKMLGISVDGILGEKTREALNSSDPTIFNLRFSLARVAKYTDLAKDERYAQFYRGWINRVLSWIDVG